MHTRYPLLFTLALCGCQTWSPTWSEITGRLHESQLMQATPTVIHQVDGSSPVSTTPRVIATNEPGQRHIVRQDVINIEPGQHNLTLVPVRSAPGGIEDRAERLQIVAEPCKRYYVQARVDSPASPTWTPEVGFVESIPGCTTAAAR
jgi:hypothetical protein